MKIKADIWEQKWFLLHLCNFPNSWHSNYSISFAFFNGCKQQNLFISLNNVVWAELKSLCLYFLPQVPRRTNHWWKPTRKSQKDEGRWWVAKWIILRAWCLSKLFGRWVHQLSTVSVKQYASFYLSQFSYCPAGSQSPVPVVPKWRNRLDRWKIG